jgi:glutaredoxin 1
MMFVEIYTRPSCGYCVRAKQLVLDKELEHSIIDVSVGSQAEQDEARQALIDRVVDQTGVPPKTMPQIFVDDQYVGGYDQLAEFLED